MASNNKPTRTEKWKANISRSMLVNRLIDNSLGKIELTALQIKSIEILLKKTIPDLKQVDHGVIKGDLTINMISSISAAPNTQPKLVNPKSDDTQV